MSECLFLKVTEEKKTALCLFGRNTLKSVQSREGGDLSVLAQVSLICCGSVKEAQPLVLRITSKEEIRLLKEPKERMYRRRQTQKDT